MERWFVGRVVGRDVVGIFSGGGEEEGRMGGTESGGGWRRGGEWVESG
jgi:hypothetical protein